MNYEFHENMSNWQTVPMVQLFDAPIRRAVTQDGKLIEKTLRLVIRLIREQLIRILENKPANTTFSLFGLIVIGKERRLERKLWKFVRRAIGIWIFLGRGESFTNF